MIKRILLGFAIVVALAVIVPVALVLLNQNPFSLVERLPLVKSFHVEGHVRMTDGDSAPHDTVKVTVRRVGGRKVSGKATDENDFHYKATFLGFTEPVAPEDTLRIRAALPGSPELAAQSEAAEGDTILIADFKRPYKTGVGPESERELLKNRRLQVWEGAPPKQADGWMAAPFATLRNLPDLLIDDEITIVARLEPMRQIEGRPPFSVTFPQDADLTSARDLRLIDLGEELERVPFTWEKKQTSIEFSFEIATRSFMSIRLYDASGVEIRGERIGKPRQTGRQSWNWDGKDSAGVFAPTGEYTFVAYANSFDLPDDPTQVKRFLAELVNPTGRHVRYGEFNRNATVAEFLDQFGLSLEKLQQRGSEEVRIRESALFFEAEPAPDEETLETTLTLAGSDTVRDLIDGFGLDLDPIVRHSEQIADFQLTVQGAEARTRVSFSRFKSAVPVESRDEFMALPLSQVISVDNGREVALNDGRPFQFRVTRRVAEEELEDWERGRVESFDFTMTQNNSLQDVMDSINRIRDVSASMRGTLEDVEDFDAMIGAPNGAKLTFYRQAEDAPAMMTANIRAAGLIARVEADEAQPLQADGMTSLPIDVTVIGLNGMPVGDDTMKAVADEGAVANGGVLAASNGSFIGTYTTPQSARPVEETITIRSGTLAKAHETEMAEGDVAGVPHMAVVALGELERYRPPVVLEVEDDALAPAPDDGEAAVDDGAMSAAPTAEGVAPLSPEDAKKMAKLYSNLTPANAAELLLSMASSQARPVLLNMPEKDAAKVIDAILTGDVGETTASLSADERKQRLLRILGTEGPALGANLMSMVNR